ncbi:hypothetical protein [Shimia sp.]|uniref:hypothetical protein n=1 Tax=Shimia sp. TaxID=1954381 RepID=UPI00329935AA
MSAELDDLLGPEPEETSPAKRSPGRPKGVTETKPRKTPEPSARRKSDAAAVQALHRPVSITFLSEAMSMDRKTVTKKLAELTPISHHRGNIPLYDFRQAMQFLVKPKVDIAAYVRKMGVADLPVALQKDVWDARLKEQKWREQAGELWATEDVLSVLGETFQRLKTTTQLWIDQVAENNALTTDARTELMSLVDGLQTDLHNSLVEMPKDRTTPSQEADHGEDEGVIDG